MVWPWRSCKRLPCLWDGRTKSPAQGLVCTWGRGVLNVEILLEFGNSFIECLSLPCSRVASGIASSIASSQGTHCVLLPCGEWHRSEPGLGVFKQEWREFPRSARSWSNPTYLRMLAEGYLPAKGINMIHRPSEGVQPQPSAPPLTFPKWAKGYGIGM